MVKRNFGSLRDAVCPERKRSVMAFSGETKEKKKKIYNNYRCFNMTSGVKS